LAATPLVGFAIFPTNHVVLLLPFILILALAWERWQRRRLLVTALLLLLVLLVPYGLYARAVFIYDPLVNDLIAVLPSVAALVGLYWMRWWVVRSPRTWFDRRGA
jgi:glycopeptide antibiotics resistance protein